MPDDRAELVKIFNLNAPQYFDKKELKDFEEFIDQYSETFFVVETDEKIIGCGGYFYNDDKTVGRISWNLFHPAYIRKGYGKRLVGHCVQLLKEEPNVKTLTVWTSQFANKFYEKFGFIVKNFHKDFWGPGLDLYRMEIDLKR
jgi:N-acetylglutamate synthase-like GNAT family acetyltransferase